MRTQKQIEAARRNGASSRGPATPEGKHRSSQNATRHGLSGTVVLLANENPESYQQLHDSYLELWQPSNQQQLDLVRDLVEARWRLLRTLALESAAIDLEMDKQRSHVADSYEKLDEPTRCALAFTALTESGTTLANLGRHEVRLRRIIDRATAELRKFQNEPGNRQGNPNSLAASDERSTPEIQ